MSSDVQEGVSAVAAEQPAARNARRGWTRKLLDAQLRERDRLRHELAQVKGLMPLLMKRRNGEHWTALERAELLVQLHALAHLSPYLVVAALPGSFLVLPLLAWWLDRRGGRRDSE